MTQIHDLFTSQIWSLTVSLRAAGVKWNAAVCGIETKKESFVWACICRISLGGQKGKCMMEKWQGWKGDVLWDRGRQFKDTNKVWRTMQTVIPRRIPAHMQTCILASVRSLTPHFFPQRSCHGNKVLSSVSMCLGRKSSLLCTGWKVWVQIERDDDRKTRSIDSLTATATQTPPSTT